MTTIGPPEFRDESNPFANPPPCPINPLHRFHGLPQAGGGCPGPWGVPLGAGKPEAIPCTRCSTGFPVPCSCTEPAAAARRGLA